MDVNILKKILTRTFRLAESGLLHPLGYAVVPIEAARPCAWGSKTIVGSFRPRRGNRASGTRGTYFIHPEYTHREKEAYFDDTKNTDQSQLEVYQFAKEIATHEKLRVVCDIGCGSAYKLLRFMSSFDTIGIDVPETCEWLRRKYPERKWIEAGSSVGVSRPVDLVIASDVIEHVLDPDKLLAAIKELRPRYVILSTPERDLLRAGTFNGPPLNPTHIREWNFDEFESYIGDHFEIIEHFISCAPQATQCILCRPRS